MTKEEMLKKSFSQAASKAVLSYADNGIDFIIIKNDMMAYAKKQDIKIAEEEIVDYIEKEIHRLNEAVKDFSYQAKISK